MELLTCWIEETLCRLNLVETMDQPKGFSRLGYSKEEQASQEQFRSIAKELGLQTFQDAAGNQWAVWQVDESADLIATGSHLDTVYNGGGYDGVAGVVASLAAVKLLKDACFKPTKNIAVIAFACEESARFNVSTIGSKAIAGLLDTDKLALFEDSSGISLKKAFTDCGLDWDALHEARLEDHQLEQFIELHIEQATQLEKTGKDIGIVRTIAQPTRLRITTIGKTNHTGSTPMDERQDALVAIAPLISFIEQETLAINQRNTPLVATVSTIQNSPNAMSMIPGEVVLGVDIRSTSAAAKHELVQKINHFVRTIEAKRAVTVSIKILVDDDPIELDPAIHATLTQLCNDIGLSSMELNSGAGHDVMNLAKRWPCGLLFIPCRNGVSHHPSEHADSDDLLKGTKVLAEYLKRVASNEDPSLD
ncbi:Zn-dependent hydrolase [Sporosarcina saromensis]|uniref:Zn-dependent hydrolase n=1 Tax=Sporosarcina saromensis TaxID=359365 RepID=A0ABU4G939_9BACL|nr:Zn-dependent hydrolase [Sporosarcina saromensis]MDW0113480.1 Zn-dependent hydrolase [Sporosarcina saromensis]